MVRIALIMSLVLGLFGGCKKGSDATCEDAVRNLLKVAGDLKPGEVEGALTEGAEECRKDNWSAATRSCFANANDLDAAKACATAQTAEHEAARHGHGDAKATQAKVDVEKYAFEAYPQWSMAHPDKACPDKLDDLNEYMNRKDLRDPWGNAFKMMCGASLPAGAKGVAILSFGPDGTEGTADDIKSWDP